MTSPRGRRVSTIRTPALVRDYLAGREGPAGPWPGDTDQERAARPSRGDYIARVHRRVVAYIKLHSRRRRPYVWPRGHSFRSTVHHLMLLGLVERTGQEGPPEERGAGMVRAQDGFQADFHNRMWIRVVPDKLDHPGWQNPVGTLYPRQGKPAAPPAPAPAPARRRPPRPKPTPKPKPKPKPAAAGVPDLDRRRQDLWARARELSEATGELARYQELVAETRSLLEALPARHRLRRGLAPHLNRLEACVRDASDPRLTRPRRVAALGSCQAATRIMAEDLSA